MARVLIVDDDAAIRTALERIVAAMGHEVVLAEDGIEAQERLIDVAFDLVITDLMMPRADGFEVLTAVRSLRSALPVIVLTAHSATAECVRAMRAGAADFIGKPFDQSELQRSVRAALASRAPGSRRPSRPSAPHWPLGALVGDSPQLRAAIEQVERAADSDVSVVLVGEPDTGKQAIARLLHSMSRRAGKPLITFRCASFAPDQIEHELFGDDRASGWLSLAEGGTLLLSQLEQQEEPLRSRLAHDLVERRAHGRLDVRVLISVDLEAGNDELAMELAASLQHTLDGVMIAMPPLRERSEDMPQLVAHFTEVANRRHGRNVNADVLVSALSQYPWPGNLTELEARIERYVSEAPPEMQEPPPQANAFAVPVQRVSVELILDDGSRHEGVLPRGPGQPVEELFEAREAFLPIRHGQSTRIYARAALACVTVRGDAPFEDDGLPRKHRAVRVTLTSGAALEGELRYVAVEGRARVTDVLNEDAPSFPLYAGGLVSYVAKAHVRSVEEL